MRVTKSKQNVINREKRLKGSMTKKEDPQTKAPPKVVDLKFKNVSLIQQMLENRSRRLGIVHASNCHSDALTITIAVGSGPNQREFEVTLDTTNTALWVPSTLCEKCPFLGVGMYESSEGKSSDKFRVEFSFSPLESDEVMVLEGETAKDDVYLGDLALKQQSFGAVFDIPSSYFPRCGSVDGVLGLGRPFQTLGESVVDKILDNFEFPVVSLFLNSAMDDYKHRQLRVLEDEDEVDIPESTSTATETAKPTTSEPTESGSSAPEPIVEDNEPITEPVVEITEPITEPVMEASEPIIESIVEGTKSTPEPIVEGTESTPEPVVEASEPIQEPAIEGTEATSNAEESEATPPEPIVEIMEPMTEPVLEGIEPIPEPIVEGTRPTPVPVTENVAPETAAVDEIVDSTFDTAETVIDKYNTIDDESDDDDSDDGDDDEPADDDDVYEDDYEDDDAYEDDYDDVFDDMQEGRYLESEVLTLNSERILPAPADDYDDIMEELIEEEIEEEIAKNKEEQQLEKGDLSEEYVDDYIEEMIEEEIMENEKMEKEELENMDKETFDDFDDPSLIYDDLGEQIQPSGEQNSNEFSLRPVSKRSEIVFGGVNPYRYYGCLFWHNVQDAENPLWSLPLDNFPTTAIIDSKSAFLYGPKNDVADYLLTNNARCSTVDELGKPEEEVSCKEGFDVAFFDKTEEAFVPLAFVINGQSYTLGYNELVQTFDGTSIIKMASDNKIDKWVFGIPFFHKYYIVLDPKLNQIGLAPSANDLEGDLCEDDQFLQVSDHPTDAKNPNNVPNKNGMNAQDESDDGLRITDDVEAMSMMIDDYMDESFFENSQPKDSYSNVVSSSNKEVNDISGGGQIDAKSSSSIPSSIIVSAIIVFVVVIIGFIIKKKRSGSSNSRYSQVDQDKSDMKPFSAANDGEYVDDWDDYDDHLEMS